MFQELVQEIDLGVDPLTIQQQQQQSPNQQDGGDPPQPSVLLLEPPKLNAALRTP